MKKLKNLLLFPTLICALFFQANAVQNGSDTVISIQPQATFPASDSDNAMLAFGWFKNGFTLEDSTTTCTFESVFPVCGNINMNGGFLNMKADINFNNLANIISGGIFWGNDYLIELSETTTSLSQGGHQTVINDGKLFFYTDLTIVGTVKFQGDCILNGHGSELYLDDNGKIVIGSNSTLKIQHTILSGITNGKIICESDSSRLLLDSVEWYQDGTYSFTQGSLKIQNMVVFGGGKNFFYESSQTSTIDSDSTWKIFDNSELSIGRKLATNYVEPLYFEDSSSNLILDNCTLNITSSGMCLTRGAIYCDRDVSLQPNSTTTWNGLILGNGISSEDAIFKFYPGSIIYFKEGHITYNITNQDMLCLKDFHSKIYRDDNNIFNVEQDVNLANIEIYKSATSSMPVKAGKMVIYDNCKIEMPNLDFYLTGSRYNDYTNSLDINDKLVIYEGNYPAETYIYNENNSIRGSGTISGSIILQNTNSELNLDFDGLINTEIYLNNGTVNLEHDLSFAQNHFFVGTGTVNLSSFELSLGNQDDIYTNTIYWDGNCSKIYLNANCELSGTWTFSGICEVEGNGQRIDLTDGAKIYIEKGSKVLFRNTLLNGLKNDNVICLDNNSKLQLDNVEVSLSGDYTFSIGSFEIYNEVEFKGSYTYEYISPIPSIINSNSELKVTNDMTIYLGNNGEINPFTFIDNTSHLQIKNANFKIGSTGFQLKKGTLFIEGEVILDIDSTSSANSLIFGTGQQEDNAKLQIGSAARVVIQNGALVYNNTIPDAIRSSSNANQFKRNVNTNFYINNNFELSKVKLEVSSTALTTIAPGKTFRYDNCTITISGGTFQVTGQIYNPYTTLLNGNDEIFMHQGTFPLYLLIQNSNNKLHGTGKLSNSITLSNSSAELNIALFGEILNNVQLNGGKIIIDNDIEIAKDNLIVGPGTVDLTTKNLYLGTRNTTWSTPICWTGSDALIDINSCIDLSSTWTFHGTCILNGNNHNLTLKENGEILIKENSTLILRNMTIEDISSNKIHCLDNSGTIIFDNVILKPNANINFTSGAFKVLNKLRISGDYTFAYQSSMTTTIQSYSTLILDQNITFSYDPGISSKTLIEFEDETASMILDSATLHTTTSLQLIKGNLFINENVYFSSEDPGKIILGNNSSSDDLYCEICCDASLIITAGILSYQNINDSSWKMLSYNSTLKIYPNTILSLQQNLNLKSSYAIFYGNAILETQVNKDLFGARNYL